MTTEIQPLETRSASQSVSVVNFTFWQFIITQTYLSMLCKLRWGVFVFFGGQPGASCSINMQLRAFQVKLPQSVLEADYPSAFTCYTCKLISNVSRYASQQQIAANSAHIPTVCES